LDDQGRRLDFHALRKTFNANLGIAGASDAERMKLARLKSHRLMTEDYNDSEKVPVADVLAKLPEFGGLKNGKARTEKDTEKDTEKLVQARQTVSKPVTSASELNGDKTTAIIGESHGLSLLDIPGLEKSNGGERGIRTPHFPTDNKGNPHDDAQIDSQFPVPSSPELSQVVTAWEKLPAPLKAAILAIVKSAE
jgi:hypothetical protein